MGLAQPKHNTDPGITHTHTKTIISMMRTGERTDTPQGHQRDNILFKICPGGPGLVITSK